MPASHVLLVKALLQEHAQYGSGADIEDSKPLVPSKFSNTPIRPEFFVGWFTPFTNCTENTCGQSMDGVKA